METELTNADIIEQGNGLPRVGSQMGVVSSRLGAKSGADRAGE